MYRNILLGSTTALVLAFVLSCTNQPPGPTAPSPSPAGSLSANADGSTLKASSPENVSPSNGTELEGTQATLVINNATGRYAGESFSYRFELSDASGNVLRQDVVAGGAGGQTQFALPDGTLKEGLWYSWRARPELNQNAGSWSSATTFRTPDPVVIDAPVPLSPVGGATLTVRNPDLVVTNGNVSGKAGEVTYYFQVATDQAFAALLPSTLAAEGSVKRDSGSTTAYNPGQLAENTLFYWRAWGSNGKVTSPYSSVASFRTPAPPPPPPPIPTPGVKAPYGPIRTMSAREALNILIRVHNELRYNLGSGTTRDSRVQWLWTGMAAVHYGHYKFNPSGGDRQWCVKDAGGGRPPSDDVMVRCNTREAWDVVGGAGANGYGFHLDYLGILSNEQNVYPPPLRNLPN